MSKTAIEVEGRGVLIGIVDSGVDYRHPAFLTADGKSRILPNRKLLRKLLKWQRTMFTRYLKDALP